MDYKKIAMQIVDAMKENIVAQKKKSQMNSYSVEMQVYNSSRGNKSGVMVEVAYKDMTDIIDKYEFKELMREVIKQLVELRKTRGWGDLSWTTNEVNLSSSWYRTDNVEFPSLVSLVGKPCKEFTSLANYMEKYCGKKITTTDIYSVGIGGKRGRVYGEEGHRYYLAHYPNKCAAILKELREYRGSKDVVNTSAFKQVDDIDEWELECSIRNEVEFSGARYNQCEVTIKTPSGKVKRVVRIGV